MQRPDGQTGSRLLPPFAALRAFEAVFRTGGIRRAAASLSLTHAVVSRHIKLLEEWVGTPLVDRSSNRLSLTDAGARYHARISTALVDLAVATRELKDQYSGNFLRLHCVPGFAIQWLSAQLSDFEKSYPQYNIELKPTDLCANLLSHEADVDIRYYGDHWPPIPGGKGLRCQELARPLVSAVASPDLLKKLVELQTVEDLLKAPLLHEDHQNEWRSWLAQNGARRLPETLPGKLYWHAHLALAAARQGRGIALGNSYLIAKELEAGELIELKLPNTQPVALGSYQMVARTDRWSTPAVMHLRRFLKSRTRVG